MMAQSFATWTQRIPFRFWSWKNLFSPSSTPWASCLCTGATSISLSKVPIQCLRCRQACWQCRRQRPLTIELLTATASSEMVLKTCETRGGAAHVGLSRQRALLWQIFASLIEATVPLPAPLIATKPPCLKSCLAIVRNVGATVAMLVPPEMHGAIEASPRSGIQSMRVVAVIPASTSLYHQLRVKVFLGARPAPRPIDPWPIGTSVV